MSRTFVLFTEVLPEVFPEGKKESRSYIQWNGNEQMLKYYADYLNTPIYINTYRLDLTQIFPEEVVNRYCTESVQHYKYAKYYSNCSGPCKFKEYFQSIHKKENREVFMKQWFQSEQPFMKDSAFIPIFNLFAYYTHRC